MVLSWNEIKYRAAQFSKEWCDAENEDAEAQSFLVAFFNVFGISSRKVYTFEHRIKKLDDSDGYIDLLWKGTLLVEMKSRGKNLDKAYTQAIDYLQCLKKYELPKYILISDFETFHLYDLDEGNKIEFNLDQFVKNVHHFGFVAGYQKRVYKEQDPVNIKAAELMGKLHDKLKLIGYEGHPLEVYLVRILFCLFADDTTIFEKDIFIDFLEQRTNEDGSDLASRLNELFYILNTPKEKRLKNIDEQLNAFPFVNGKLFEESLPPASFDSGMRQILLECCGLNWGKISPAIFGSMFQSVMNPKDRRNIGAHYTSEKNILKLIRPLFLDKLWDEFNSCKGNKIRLLEFHTKISKLKFLDPACGCGNFLVITYRELRLLEMEILRLLYGPDQGVLDVRNMIFLDVDMMYGIECEEFPARIAEVAMWLIDHQMNMAVSEEFGQYFVRLPLKKSAKIIHGNALQIDWESIISKEELSYILGNPPFVGKSLQGPSQKKDMELIFTGFKGTGVLDYVSAWYLKAAQIMQETNIRTAFVSTNSISQGEQVGILWNILFNKFKIKIHFAHKSFKWGNEARGNAAVHVVIVAFANYNIDEKIIFEYDEMGNSHEIKVKNINPYLVEGKDFAIVTRQNPICKVPKVVWGNKPVDGGNLIISNEDLSEFLNKEPSAEKFVKPLISAKQFLNGEKRWCLWLVDALPSELHKMPLVLERVRQVKKMREESVDEGARKLASRPTQFRDVKNPDSFILIPSTTSVNRKYIPFAFFLKDNISHNSCHILPNGNIYHFGILSSLMHMVWVKYVCGRLKSDYRYSNDIVYNNFPWPDNPGDRQVKGVELASRKVLDTRSGFPNCSLAELYNPFTMPAVLVKAHQELDKAVDICYRPQPFTTEAKRMEYLFELYEKYTAGLFSKKKSNKIINKLEI